MNGYWQMALTAASSLMFGFVAGVRFMHLRMLRESHEHRIARASASVGGAPEWPDPTEDPEALAMMREVVRTGRPMSMNRGEPPRFVDDGSSDSGGVDR